MNTPINKTRFTLGGILLVCGFLSPLLTPLVISSGLPGFWKTAIATGLVVGIPEVAMFAAVAVLGKQGFEQLKRLLFSFLRKHTSTSEIGQTRYRIGLAMFAIPLFFGWVAPYLVHFLPDLGGKEGFNSISSVIVLDGVFVASFLVLGAGFWEKIRNLFIHDPDQKLADPQVD